MSNEDILCEAEGPAGMVCMLPYGHQPADVHMYETQLPKDLGRLMENIMQATEQERQQYRKWRKRERIAFYLWVGMFIVYCTISIMEVAS